MKDRTAFNSALVMFGRVLVDIIGNTGAMPDEEIRQSLGLAIVCLETLDDRNSLIKRCRQYITYLVGLLDHWRK